jgi:hypothetical protein
MAFDRIGDALQTGLSLIAARLSENLTSRGSVASGELGESITVPRPKVRGGKWTAQVLMNDYWWYVDQGRKPGKRPPIQSIIEWLNQPGVADRMTFGREDLFNRSAIPSIAYAISKKIGEKGTKGTNFATDVFESDLVDDLANRVGEAAVEDLENVMDEIERIMLS